MPPEVAPPAPGARRRVRPLVAALAVLAALSGSAGTIVAVSRTLPPPPLRLAGPLNLAGEAAGPAALGVPAPPGGPGSGGVPAPGWFGPLRLVGPLPEAVPPPAPVRRLSGGRVDAAVVARLAAALGVPGAPVRVAAGWAVTAGRARLSVSDHPGQRWYFARWAVEPGCEPGAPPPSGPGAVPCGSADGPVAITAAPGPGPGGGPQGAPDPGRARQLADTVLRAAGVPDGDLAAARLQAQGPLVTVTVDPRVAGLRTTGWTSEVTVDGVGVLSAAGWLAPTRFGPSYPLVDARTAFRELERRPRALLACRPLSPAAPPGSPTVPPVSPAGGPGGSGASPNPGDAAPDCPELAPVPVSGAELGLTLGFDRAVPVLVPAWLFHVAGADRLLTQVAVLPRFLAPGPTGPQPPGPPSR